VVAAGTSASAVPLAVRSLLLVDFRPRLAAIRQPVLIANGTLDQRAMAQEASLLAALPQGEGHHFENCEHGVSLRRPAEFAALVDTFASRAFAPPARLP
jgi:pimeloyl-ACP methyl ester carboxylesterase